MHKDKAVGVQKITRPHLVGFLKNANRKVGSGSKMLQNLGLVSSSGYWPKERQIHTNLLGHGPSFHFHSCFV